MSRLGPDIGMIHVNIPTSDDPVRIPYLPQKRSKGKNIWDPARLRVWTGPDIRLVHRKLPTFGGCLGIFVVKYKRGQIDLDCMSG